MTSSLLSDLPRFLTLDGGLGTEIRRRVGIVHLDPLWGARVNHTDGKVLRDIQIDFLASGADVILTNTYKPDAPTYMSEFSVDRNTADGYLRAAARTSCEVRDEFWDSLNDEAKKIRSRPLVGASIGTYGTFVGGSDYSGLYLDETSKEIMSEAFREKAVPLVEGGVDILAFETIPGIKEAEAIFSTMAHFPGKKAWIVFCCKDGQHLGNGDKFSDAVLTTLSCDAVIGVGINCTPPQYVTSLLKEIPDIVKEKKRILVYPNNGLDFDLTVRKWVGSPDTRSLESYVPEWMDHGATWIGGCCNVFPEHIVSIRQAMDNYLKANDLHSF